MPINYDEVLADLKRRKTELEAAILGIEGLVAHRPVVEPTTSETPEPAVHVGVILAENQTDASVPQRVLRFLESQPGKSFTIADIVRGAEIKKIQTLRGALGRLVKSGKIGKHGRGRYRVPRPKAQTEAEA